LKSSKTLGNESELFITILDLTSEYVILAFNGCYIVVDFIYPVKFFGIISPFLILCICFVWSRVLFKYCKSIPNTNVIPSSCVHVLSWWLFSKHPIHFSHIVLEILICTFVK
jgi:hypothetical protein